MIKTIIILTALLGAHHVHDTTPELADAIDLLCDADIECKMDAITTFYRESRCRMNICGRNGCGPFQQLPRYADTLDGLSDAKKRSVLSSDALVATRQFLDTRSRYKSRHGENWPNRYAGGRDGYQYRWYKTRKHVQRIIKNHTRGNK